jgi:DNA-binding LytR/AlgR family response regulator
VRVNLDTALSLLPPDRFVRIHRSFAISFDQIELMGKEVVSCVIADKQLPVSKKYYAEFVKKIIILEPDAFNSLD